MVLWIHNYNQKMRKKLTKMLVHFARKSICYFLHNAQKCEIYLFELLCYCSVMLTRVVHWCSCILNIYLHPGSFSQMYSLFILHCWSVHPPRLIFTHQSCLLYPFITYSRHMKGNWWKQTIADKLHGIKY